MNPKRIIASIGVLTALQKSPQIGNPPPVLTFFNPAIPLPPPPQVVQLFTLPSDWKQKA